MKIISASNMPEKPTLQLVHVPVGAVVRYQAGQHLYMKTGAFSGRLANYMNGAKLQGYCLLVRLDTGEIYPQIESTPMVLVDADVSHRGDLITAARSAC